MSQPSQEKLKKIVWFAGFESRNSSLIFKLIRQKSWQHIFNSGVMMGNYVREKVRTELR